MKVPQIPARALMRSTPDGLRWLDPIETATRDGKPVALTLRVIGLDRTDHGLVSAWDGWDSP